MRFRSLGVLSTLCALSVCATLFAPLHAQADSAAGGPAAVGSASSVTPTLTLNPTDWLVERDSDGTVALHAVVRGTRLRDLSQPGWRIESDLVSGAMFAVPTRAGSVLRDERREAVALAPNAAAQLSLVAPPAAGAVVIVHPAGRPGAGLGPPPPPRPALRPPRSEHGFALPPTHSIRPTIAPLIPDFPTR